MTDIIRVIHTKHGRHSFLICQGQQTHTTGLAHKNKHSYH